MSGMLASYSMDDGLIRSYGKVSVKNRTVPGGVGRTLESPIPDCGGLIRSSAHSLYIR